MILYQALSILLGSLLILIAIFDVNRFLKTAGIRSLAHLRSYIKHGKLPGEVSAEVRRMTNEIAAEIARQNPRWTARRVKRNAQKVVSEVIYKALQS